MKELKNKKSSSAPGHTKSLSSDKRPSDDRKAALRRNDIERQKIKRRKRRKKLAVNYTIFTLIVAAFMFFILNNMISDKEELRKKGIDAYNNGNYSEAIEAFTASLNEEQWFTKNMDLDTRIYLGDCYLQLNQYGDAQAVYIELKSLNHGNYNEEYIDSLVGAASAMVDMENGNYDSAAAYLTEAVNEGNTWMNLYLGACYEKQGDYGHMMACYHDYLLSYPMNTYIAYQISTYYLNAEDYSSAKDYIDKGLSAGDTAYLSFVKYNEIVYYEQILDYTTAFAKAKEYINAYPDNEAGRKEYDFLYTRINIDPEPVHKPDESADTDSSASSSGSADIANE